MRLLFINHHRKSKTAIRAGNLAKHLTRRGCDVTLICVAEHERFRIREYEEEGVHYVETPDLLFGRLRSGWDLWCALSRCIYLRKRDRYDLVHAFETRPATIYPVRSLLKRRRIPLVIDWIDWWGGGGLIEEQRPLWYRLLLGKVETYFEEHFRRLADGTTVISHALAERAVELGVDRKTIHRVPGGASVDIFRPEPKSEFRAKYGLPGGAFIVGFSALDVTIDAELVFKAVRAAARSHPEILLVMAGDNLNSMRRLAVEAGIDKRFKHLGKLPYGNILSEALSCADVFVLPFADKIANRGRWPNKIGDYMSLGRPTITNPVGEMKILFDENNVGLLVDESPEGFSKGILKLIGDPEQCRVLGKNARETAEKKFAWELIVKRLEGAYEDVIRRFGAR